MTESSHIDQRTLDLLNGSIDGELSAADLIELEQLLAASAETRKLHEELKQLSGLLDSAPELEPPEYLQNVIESQVTLPSQKIAYTKGRRLFENWLPAHWLRTGFALAAGAFLTVGLYQMGSEPMSAREEASMVGTVVEPQKRDQLELLDSVNIATKTFSGLVELSNTDDLFLLDMRMNSDVPSEIVVILAGHGMELEGVSGNQGNEDTVLIGDDSISVAINGKQQVTLQLRSSSQAGKTAPLELEFYANGTLVQATELSVSRH